MLLFKRKREEVIRVFSFAIYVVFLLVLSEVVSRFAISLIDKTYRKDISLTSNDLGIINSILEGKNRYTTLDPDLGWVTAKNAKIDLYESNSRGIRSNKEYNYNSVPFGVTRILAFGDSFTHSDDVSNKDSWASIIENKNKDLEVLNYGVPAYGIDQAYIRFNKEANNVSANIVLIGMMSENVYRHINTFRKFYQPRGGFPLGKPRFIDSGASELELIPNWLNSTERYEILISDPLTTLSEIGKYDYYFNNKPPDYDCGFIRTPCALKSIRWLIREKIDRGQKDPWTAFLLYDMNSEGPRLSSKISVSFANSVKVRGMKPIFVIFPNKTDYLQYKYTRTKNYTPLITASLNSGTETWDAMDAFVEGGHLLPYEAMFTDSSGHYSVEGNLLIAQWMSKKIDLVRSQQYK